MRKRHKTFYTGISQFDLDETAHSGHLVSVKKPNSKVESKKAENTIDEFWPEKRVENSEKEIPFEVSYFHSLLSKYNPENYGGDVKRWFGKIFNENENAINTCIQILYEIDYDENDPEKTMAFNGHWGAFKLNFYSHIGVLQKLYPNFEEMFLIALCVVKGTNYLMNEIRYPPDKKVALISYLEGRVRSRVKRKKFFKVQRGSVGNFDNFMKLCELWKKTHECNNFLFDFSNRVFGSSRKDSVIDELKALTIKKKYKNLSKEFLTEAIKKGKNVSWSDQTIKIVLADWLIIWANQFIRACCFDDEECLRTILFHVSDNVFQKNSFRLIFG